MERYFTTTQIGFDQAEDSKSPGRLTGYVTRWNTLSHDRGGYKDVFRPDAFANLLDSETDVKAYQDHNYSIYLGRTSNHSLKLSMDSEGVRFSLDLPDTQHGRDTAALMSRNDFNGMSFGYLPEKFQLVRTDEGIVREHISGTLVEVSVVFDPAFESSSVELNALDESSEEVLQQIREFLGTPKLNVAKRKLQLASIDTSESILVG